MIRFSALILGSLLVSSAMFQTAYAQEATPPPPPLESPFDFDGPMTPQRLGELIKRVDPDAETLGNGYSFRVQERELRVVFAEEADRMRIITPIIPARNLPEGLLLRMMQANYDSVLDTRYAVGGGNVWSVFIHRLSSLTDEDFISGIAQTAVGAATFGTSFTSGALGFTGGDSGSINEELLKRLEDAAEDSVDDRGI